MTAIDENLGKTFTAPICPACATPYDRKHYDFVEDRACCPNCGTHYRIWDDHVPDIPNEALDLGNIWDD